MPNDLFDLVSEPVLRSPKVIFLDQVQAEGTDLLDLLHTVLRQGLAQMSELEEGLELAAFQSVVAHPALAVGKVSRPGPGVHLQHMPRRLHRVKQG